MTLYEELKARGLIAQVTNEPEISEMINNGKADVYKRQDLLSLLPLILSIIRPKTFRALLI